MDGLLKYFNKQTDAAPLATFRIIFGTLMLIGIARFWAYGWIEKLYIEPKFHFKYFGFEFVNVPGAFTYWLFVFCGLCALLVALGYCYKWAIVGFFLSFTYIELMDKTTYLNHYYFISLLSFLLIFLPAGRYFSIDGKRNPDMAVQYIPRWNIDAIKLMLAIVYIYAGAAKLNYDWMSQALPLSIWLPSNYGLPLIGDLLQQKWLHYAFSWMGAVYDLTIVFFLLYKPTRAWAFAAVVVFHVLTGILFPIGMFPYIMIAGTLIFFDAGWHQKLLARFSKIFGIDKSFFDNQKQLKPGGTSLNGQLKMLVIAVFFVFQLLVPLRFVLYPGNLFWTEQGYRFSWRVMLMEKTGHANFKIVDGNTRKRFYVNNYDFLNAFQEKQMSTQPDMILEYAHFLGRHFESMGHQKVKVFVESYAALNGRGSRPFIDPEVDLMTVEESFQHKDWVLPFYE